MLDRLHPRILLISGAAKGGTIHYENINLNGNYGIFTAIPQFCAANDVFVVEQARRLARETIQPAPSVTALKVGDVRTNIRAGFPLWMKIAVALLADPFFRQTPEQIAASALRLLMNAEFEGVTGALFTHIKEFKRSAPARQAASRLQREWLWNLSEQIVDDVRVFGFARAGSLLVKS
jgi:hypothetical protein